MIARRWLAVALVVASGIGPLRAIDLSQRSESGTKQFIVYSDDIRLRQRVASFAEEIKGEVMQLLNESNLWRAPIVITLAKATTLELREPPARLRVAETDSGFKIELQVKIGDDPAAVNLRKLIVRAVLLEYAYREGGIASGEAFVEAPWWMIEGVLEIANRRARGAESTLFQRLIETNRLPPIENFLRDKPDELGPTALAVDGALAMCLVQLLTEQPGGRSDLARLLRDWPRSNGDPAALLARNFPSIGAGQNLQKWWTLSLARFAAADRYQNLTAEETERALEPLLKFELVINKAGEKRSFALGDFHEYRKLPASRALLSDRHGEIVALSTRANALYRPMMADYEEIFALLKNGKTRGLSDRLARAEKGRRFVLRRAVEVADYLNWFEATQMSSRSSAFDNYLKLADELTRQEQTQKGAVGRYLDALEQEY